MKYNAATPTRFTLIECEELVGSKARLPLTGRIVEARDGPSGAFIMFEPDARWGLSPGTRFGVDLEALDHVDSRQSRGLQT